MGGSTGESGNVLGACLGIIYNLRMAEKRV